MLSTDADAQLQALYPALAGLDVDFSSRLFATARTLDVAAGTELFGAGSPCTQFPFVVSGSIRVAKTGDGRELHLYRVGPGETCVLTSSCLVGGSDYPARGIAETDTRLVVLPREAFDALLGRHAPFRRYVFSLFADRLAELMGLVEAVAFHKLDRRVAVALLGRGKVIGVTHQQLADEVGSVREIVTRILKGFVEEGLVRLGRGEIEVLDAIALRNVAAGLQAPTPSVT